MHNRKSSNATRKSKAQLNDYQQLERLLKASKAKFSGILVENLSKLVFLQSEIKMTANPLACASYVLTGGACLLMRNDIYHADIAETVAALAHELKLLFAQLVNKKQGLTCDVTSFAAYVDYEANILIRVLHLVVKSMAANLEIIPTPGYLINYDAASMRVSQHFLPWLATQDKELLEMYNVNTMHAVLWVFNGKKIADMQAIKTMPKECFNPYLRLAILLRADEVNRSAANKKTALGWILHPEDFENVGSESNLYVDLLARIVRLIPMSFNVLLKFKAAIKSAALKNIVVTTMLRSLQDEYVGNMSVDFQPLVNIMQQIGDSELTSTVNELYARQQEGTELLSMLNINDSSKKIIRGITKIENLRSHLTLMLDTFLLNHAELSIQYFTHWDTLKTSKKINRLLPITQIIDDNFPCFCVPCLRSADKNAIVNLGRALDLPIVDLTKLNCHYKDDAALQPTTFKPTVLSQPDPFQILGVTLTDSKPIIMRKVMQLIQQMPEQMSVVRQAQSELFNPARRFLHHYLRFIAYENNIAPMETVIFKQEFLHVEQ